MATLSIAEFNQLGDGTEGVTAQIAKHPPLATQVVSYTTATNSAAFQSTTRYLRLASDADLYYSLTGTATANSIYLAAGQIEYIGVDSSDTLSAYDGSS